MKKITSLLSIALCVCVNVIVYGQDIVYTKDGNSIQTKILEISDGRISYKLFDYQEGATIILEIDKIDSIVYQNGYVDKLNIHRAEKSLSKSDKAVSTEMLPRLTNRYSPFLFDNGMVLDVRKFEDFLRRNSLSNIWTDYKTGKKLFGTGLGLILGGGGTAVLGLLFRHTSEIRIVLAGLIMPTIGILCIIAGIPTIIVGGAKRKNALNNYNDHYAGKLPVRYAQSVLLQFGNTSQGLGFTLNF